MSGKKWNTEKTEILDDDFFDALNAEIKKRYPNNTSKIKEEIEILDDLAGEDFTKEKEDTQKNKIENTQIKNDIAKNDSVLERKEESTPTYIPEISKIKTETIEIINEQIEKLEHAQETIEESIHLLSEDRKDKQNIEKTNILSNKLEELSKTSKDLEDTIDLLRLDIPSSLTTIEAENTKIIEEVELTEKRNIKFKDNSYEKSEKNIYPTKNTPNFKTENRKQDSDLQSKNLKSLQQKNETTNKKGKKLEEIQTFNAPSKNLENSIQMLELKKPNIPIEVKNKMKPKKWPWILLFILCMSIIGFLTYKTFFWQRDSLKTNRQIENIIKTTKTKESIIKKENIIGATTPEDDRFFNYLDVDFQELLQKNSDVKGWIKVNNTNINYPFVQSETNDFYLNHSFDKSFNTAGWVFADFRNKFDTLDQNTILYAHGRLDDTMFGSLKKIVEKNWYENMANEFLQMSTLESNSIWQVFSVYTIEPEIYYITPNFETTEEYQDFLETLKERSVHNFQIDLNTNDKILTLSSCYNDTLRIVLHAKLVNIEQK